MPPAGLIAFLFGNTLIHILYQESTDNYDTIKPPMTSFNYEAFLLNKWTINLVQVNPF